VAFLPEALKAAGSDYFLPDIPGRADTGVNLPESRTVEGSGEAVYASDGDSQEGARARTPRHADEHGQLVSTYQNQGRWKEAEQLQLQVMETSLRVLGPGHPDALTSMANLAYTWKSQGRDEICRAP